MQTNPNFKQFKNQQQFFYTFGTTTTFITIPII